jgi:group I intron endonuclease
MEYSVYKITNNVTKMSYIGQTIKSLDRRFKDHCKQSSNCLFLRRAIEKYGKDNFEVSLIMTQPNKELANLEEKRSISEYNTIAPYGYNLTFGGEGGIPSEETRKKMSISHSGIKHHNYGKHLPEQTRKKISDSRIGSKNPMYGRSVPMEVKAKISIANKGRPAHNKGKSTSEETKNKISEALKGAKNHNYQRSFSKEHRAKISESLIGNTRNIGRFRFTDEQAIDMKRLHSDGKSYNSIAKMYDTTHSVVINAINRITKQETIW